MGLADRHYMRGAEQRQAADAYEKNRSQPPRRPLAIILAATAMILLLLLFSC